MISSIELTNSKYIFNTWKQFTTLTEEEQKNLKEILQFNKILKMRQRHSQQRRKKILWITLK